MIPRIASVFLLALLFSRFPRADAEPQVRPRWVGDALHLDATLHASGYRDHPGRYHGHHAIVFAGGGAADKAFLRTPVPDRAIAAALAKGGFDSAGGIATEAWDRRFLAEDPASDQRAAGTPLTVEVRWEGGAWVELGRLLGDREGRGLDLRFADNRAWIPTYRSGCVVCLASCPGSKIANRTYSIRENEHGPMEFAPIREDLPPDGAAAEVRIRRR